MYEEILKDLWNVLDKLVRLGNQNTEVYYLIEDAICQLSTTSGAS